MIFRFRVTPELLDQIETLLPAERAADGSPSAHDFIAHDLFAIGDDVTERWDDLPRTFTSRDDYARYVKPGSTVAVISLVVQRVADEIIDVDIDIDRGGLPTPDEDDDQRPLLTDNRPAPSLREGSTTTRSAPFRPTARGQATYPAPRPMGSEHGSN